MKKIPILLITLLLLHACGGISVLSSGSPEELYRPAFLKKVEVAKSLYGNDKKKEAIAQLKALKEEDLLPAERGLKRNLMGVMFFSMKDYEQAIYQFDLALAHSRLDLGLTAQIYLNLASCYFKLGHMEKAFSTINLADHQNLRGEESRKYHQLKYSMAKELDRPLIVLESLIWALSKGKSLDEVKGDPLYSELLGNYFKFSERERIRFLEEFQSKKIFIIAHLGHLEVEKLFYSGRKEDARDLMDWIEKDYGEYQEIQDLMKRFRVKEGSLAKIDPLSIGVILPLSGKKANFGKRALMGIDNALRELDKSGRLSLHVMDSKGSGIVGALMLKELIEKHRVAAVVGGLFPDEAKKEYIESKIHGVFFVSLSQIYLQKGEKDHLLLEIPGSVESEVAQLFKENMIKKFGRKGAIIYPNSERGHAFLDEFWRQSQIKNMEIIGAYEFDKNATDHRGPVKKLLGLQFNRERLEELEFLKDVYSLEGHKSIKRIQTLRPQIDFDWVFLPAHPHEALQLIPSFTYYDAFGINLIGGPSWRSRSLSRESLKLGKLFFVGDSLSSNHDEFSESFFSRYGKRPLLVETRAYDSAKAIFELLRNENFEKREDFDIHIRAARLIQGATGSWSLEDGIWVKKLEPLELWRGEVKQIDFKSENSESEDSKV